MRIIGIASVAVNNVIGKDHTIPWKYTEDTKFFKETTSGNVVVMGFETYLSIGKPLSNRLNIILSRSRYIEIKPGLIILRSVDEVINLFEYLNRDIYIAGGSQIYDVFKPYINEWFVTRIPNIVKGNVTYMPADFLEGFEHTGTMTLDKDGLNIDLSVQDKNDL